MHVDFPRAAVAAHLAETFQAFVAWIWLDADGSFGYELNGLPPGSVCRADVDELAVAAVHHHPLVQWYRRSVVTTPMSLHRLPRELRATAEWGNVAAALEPYDLEQQLAIPYRCDHAAFRAFVVARGGQDFTDSELELARQMQPLLALLDRPAGEDTDSDLTAREIAVLQGLADGLTAGAIGHRLLVSERTVHAHLRSIYRKLDVTDRVRAVVAAGDLGLVTTEDSGRPGGEGLPGPSGQARDLSGFWAQ